MDWIEMSAQLARRVLRSVGLVLVLVRPLATSRPKVQRRRLRLFHCPCRPRRMPRRYWRVPRRDALSRRGVASATGPRRTGITNRNRRAQPWRGIGDLRSQLRRSGGVRYAAGRRHARSVGGNRSAIARGPRDIGRVLGGPWGDSGDFARTSPSGAGKCCAVAGRHAYVVRAGRAGAGRGRGPDTLNLRSLTAFARAAARGEKRMLIAHSEIFPGTYASTTETADWTITALGLRRTPVLNGGRAARSS